MADSLGQVLRSTRERKRISLSYAAAQTRIKIQYLEWMERDDFSRIPAPAYAKGFIKMYAEFLGLDPQPLVQEYVAVHVGKKPTRLHEMSMKPPPPTRKQEAAPVPAPAAPAEPAPAPVEESEPAPKAARPRREFKRPDFSGLTRMLANLPWRQIISIVSVVVAVVALVNAMARCARHPDQIRGGGRPVEFKRGVPATVQDLPEPYLPIPAEPAERTP